MSAVDPGHLEEVEGQSHVAAGRMTQLLGDDAECQKHTKVHSQTINRFFDQGIFISSMKGSEGPISFSTLLNTTEPEKERSEPVVKQQTILAGGLPKQSQRQGPC